MPVPIKCQNCGKIMWVSPSTARRIKNCPSCKMSHIRKKYHVDDKEFKQVYKAKMPLICWKAREVSEGDPDIYEELKSRYLLALYRNFARKEEIKNFDSSFNCSLNYETKRVLEELSSKREYTWEFIDKFEEDMDSRIMANNYLKEVKSYLLRHHYNSIIDLYFNNVPKEKLVKELNTSINKLDNQLYRQRKMLRRDLKEIITYLRG